MGCDTCRHWVEGEPGTCRRYPPVPFVDVGKWEWRQPETYDSDWCGEHQEGDPQ